MDHVFLTVYFNPMKYESRKRLTTEFLQRYPWVKCIEVVYGSNVSEIMDSLVYRKPFFDGWATQWALNKYFKTRPDIKSLTFIDSDLMLPDHFKEMVLGKLDGLWNLPCFIHGFDICDDSSAPGSNILYAPAKSGYNGGTHTGYIYTFTRGFLDCINNTFPEDFVYGGFDYVLWCILTGNMCCLEKLLPNKSSNIYKEVSKLKDKLTDVQYCNINCRVKHLWHGNKSNRMYNERFTMYNDGQSSLENINLYFKVRNEDSKK